jgi:hypothetical protein
MRATSFLIVSGAAVAAILSASLAEAQKQAAPTAPPGAKGRYAMDVETVTGMAAMASGSAGAAMSMMFGGGGNREARMLHLRLDSTIPPVSSPKADHFLMPAAKLGKSVPLLSPEPSKIRNDTPGEMPKDFQRPKGRLLLFWGCGPKAQKGQPVIIDFAKMTAGMKMPQLMSVRVPMDRGASYRADRAYGEWPNSKSGKQPGRESSLIGDHRIASNYAPEIKFALAQDYMPGLTANPQPGAAGSVNLSWNSVTGATGYYAWVMGATMGQDGPRDMVWWTSSSVREYGGALADWLPPATVQRLIGEKVVMPPSQTSCTVPAEVKAAAPDFMFGNLYAYGPEANFSYPPRPAGAPAGWTPDWTARVRFRAHTGWMDGAGMAGAAAASQPEEKKRCKPSILGAVLGAGC